MSESMNWKKMTDETVSNLVRLIRMQTINPPGNELPAILVVKDILEAAGVPAEMYQIVESAPNRANLVARLKGDGSARPLLLSGHVDVVPVERERWTHEPFGGEVIDGMVWGRGALDMKGFLAMYMQVFLELFRRNVPLKRDVILAAIADEENGYTYGSKFLVDTHPELIDAEYCLTEGGAVTLYFGKTRIYPIQVAEKQVCILRGRATGKPGHGSIPQMANPVFPLAEAIEKLKRAGHLPVHITPIYLKMMARAAKQAPFPVNIFLRSLQNPTLLGAILDYSRGDIRNILRAMVTNTVSPTMLQAGSKVTVIPSAAEMGLDCRLVPGQSPEDIKKELHQVFGEEIELETMFTTRGAQFSTDTPFYHLLEQATCRMDPDSVVVPILMPGATDACQYQSLDMQVYGFTPGVLPPGLSLLEMIHGHDERMPISFIESGLPVLWDVVTEFCGKGTN
jgi:acetylornithine deacetylase/succinyl-diaminopimelate desuccinylase-like protein